MSNFNPSRLFNASCFALITTAFAFAIRAGILKELATDFNLTDTQLGYINQMVLGIGFPIATIAGGLLYNQFGAKRMMMVALLVMGLFSYRQLGIDQNSRAFGQFESTGVRPTFINRLEAKGVKLPSNMFAERILQARQRRSALRVGFGPASWTCQGLALDIRREQAAGGHR